ncbi:MAG: anti-sigma factor [Actinomycetota bacterium]|nr:anti-sigma factor [Actinomycetota bacterium]
MSPQSHNDWKEQLPAYLLDALSPGERTDLEHHLGGCAECQAELRWLEPVRQELAEGVAQVDPPPALRARVMAAVEADLAEHPAEAAHAEVRPAQTRRKRLFDFGALLRPAALGAMATVLFAGVVLGYAVRGDDSAPDGPVVTERVIPAKPSAAGADAVMVITGSSGTLKVTGLPGLEDGEVYQAWVQKGQSVEPTDSLFSPRRDGTATTSIPDLGGVSTVMVSAEPAGGSQQPTTVPIITVPITS